MKKSFSQMAADLRVDGARAEISKACMSILIANQVLLDAGQIDSVEIILEGVRWIAGEIAKHRTQST